MYVREFINNVVLQTYLTAGALSVDQTYFVFALPVMIIKIASPYLSTAFGVNVPGQTRTTLIPAKIYRTIATVSGQGLLAEHTIHRKVNKVGSFCATLFGVILGKKGRVSIVSPAVLSFKTKVAGGSR